MPATVQCTQIKAIGAMQQAYKDLLHSPHLEPTAVTPKSPCCPKTYAAIEPTHAQCSATYNLTERPLVAAAYLDNLAGPLNHSLCSATANAASCWQVRVMPDSQMTVRFCPGLAVCQHAVSWRSLLSGTIHVWAPGQAPGSMPLNRSYGAGSMRLLLIVITSLSPAKALQV